MITLEKYFEVGEAYVVCEEDNEERWAAFSSREVALAWARVNWPRRKIVDLSGV